ncbi:MAG: hypothetical protein V3R74_01890 [Alphaproteobacteria bacterium]
MLEEKELYREARGLAVAGALVVALVLAGGGSATLAGEVGAEPRIPEGVERVPHDSTVFRPDPTYEDKPYDVDAQIEIYGGKTEFKPPRPLLELGREIYTAGPFTEAKTYLGDKNPLAPHFYVYGDLQTVVGYADNGAVEVGQLATRLNLDLDLGITPTERIHAFLRPLDRGGKFTRYEFYGDDDDENFEGEFNGNIEALFFEGDVGPITQGITGEYNNIDLPFAVGFMPLLMQNGIWLEDAFIGVAATIPAMNSPALDISNADVTVFAGFDQVDSQAFIDTVGDVANHNVNIYGVTAFIEANQGYWEIGYGYSDGEGANLDDFDYHNLTAAFTRRYGSWLSNSVRGIWNFGQDAPGRQQTADGFILFVENSLITRLPTTLVPYANFWAGFDRPQGLGQQARGLLKNTGINFETDAITQFPKLDDTGRNTYGGALGLEYLFELDQQIVVEVATAQVIEGDNEPGRPALGDQYAIGFRYQLPITKAWIVRADGMYGFREFDDDIRGLRLELRRKF